MYDIYRLNKELRQSEHETATALYRQILDSGFTAEKAVTLVYRAGLVDGKAAAIQRNRRNEYHKALYAEQPTNSPLAAESEDMIDE